MWKEINPRVGLRGETLGRATENVEVVVEEDSVLSRITDPLAQQDRGDDLEDTGNSGVVGVMDINVENNEFFENSEDNAEEVLNGGAVQIPNLVLTDEEKIEINVDPVGVKPCDQSTKVGVDKDGIGKRLPMELHDNNCGDANMEAILIVGQTITKISHPRAKPPNDKGKHVMESSQELGVGPKTRSTWKKRARVATHQVLPVPLTREESGSRKRSMEDSLHDHHEGENSLKKKCKTVSGVDHFHTA
ncbi:hypothetical protein FCV25MIE_21426 [Fagus crenata]